MKKYGTHQRKQWLLATILLIYENNLFSSNCKGWYFLKIRSLSININIILVKTLTVVKLATISTHLIAK